MSPDALGVRVDRLPGLTRYRFQAELPLLWTERLAEGFASRGEDIAELDADRRDGLWHVELSVRGRPDVDIEQLLEGRDHRAAPLARHHLESYQVRRDADGTLLVTLRALDRPGFLAFMLREFRTLALFPARVKARSVGRWAEDRFTLVSVGGASASVDTARALENVLGAHALQPLRDVAR